MRLILISANAAFLALTGSVTGQDAANEPPLPQPRPQSLGEAPEASDSPDTERPEKETEPARIYQTACPALLSGRIVGQLQEPIAENQCGLQNPIAVSAIEVNGREISLAGAPVTDCGVATVLADWAEAVDAHAKATLGTRIATLGTGTGYQCRLRNGEDTGFLSEHGRGNALDLASISFEDGSTISILDDWQTRPASQQAKFLAFAHGAACARFTTVLGPEANADHEDHFHFDLGCHGQSCTAVICQ